MSNEEEEETWEFEPDDVAREEHAKMGPMGDPDPKKEYKVERRLVDDDTGERFYKVEKEEGGTHVYAENVLDLRYEPISIEESRVWPKDEDGELFTDGGVEQWDRDGLDVWEVNLVYNGFYESPSDECLTVMAPDRETAISEARRVSDGNPPEASPVYNDGDSIVSPRFADNADRFGGDPLAD